MRRGPTRLASRCSAIRSPTGAPRSAPGERRELGLDGLLLSPSILRLPSMWRGLAMLLPFSLGLAVPAVGIGVATHYISATAAVTGPSGLLLALLATVAALTARSAAAPKPTPRL